MGFRSSQPNRVLTFQVCNELFKKARYCKYLSTNVIWTNTGREVEKVKGVRLENNTYLIKHADCYSVRLYDTDIIDIYPNKWVFSNGGYRTITTKDRIQRYSVLSISVSKYVWYYRIGNWTQDTDTKVFQNGLTLTKEEILEHLI